MNTRDQAAINCYAWKAQGLRVGMASGAFDLFHAGHLSFLNGLRGHVDKLIVAVMDDANCRRKGEGRPIIPDWQRVAIVSALSCVDDAFMFSEYGDAWNLEKVRPDVFGRGDGHTTEIHERDTIEKLGIELVLVHTPRIISTTDIISRIHESR